MVYDSESSNLIQRIHSNLTPLFSKKNDLNHQPTTIHTPHLPPPIKEGKMSPQKKTTKLHGWLPGYPFQGDRLGRQQIRKALTTQARPGRTSRDGWVFSRRVVKE